MRAVVVWLPGSAQVSSPAAGFPRSEHRARPFVDQVRRASDQIRVGISALCPTLAATAPGKLINIVIADVAATQVG